MMTTTKKKPRRRRSPPTLRFSPFAWAKLLYLRDQGTTEIGGFGITPPGDSLFVQDVQLVAQRCTPVTVKFDDVAVADFFDGQIDAGRKPEEFGRIWIHTHPGESARPSHTDEHTLDRVFGECDWAVMAILARSGQSYARLRFNRGPQADVAIPMEVDFSLPFPSSDIPAWEVESGACVTAEELLVVPRERHRLNVFEQFGDWDPAELGPIEW
jgi:hypothetical protein